MAPDPIRQPPSVEIGVDGHVVAEPLGRSEQNVEFDLLDRRLGQASRARPLDGGEQFFVVEGGVSSSPAASSSEPGMRCP